MGAQQLSPVEVEGDSRSSLYRRAERFAERISSIQLTRGQFLAGLTALASGVLLTSSVSFSQAQAEVTTPGNETEGPQLWREFLQSSDYGVLVAADSNGVKFADYAPVSAIELLPAAIVEAGIADSPWVINPAVPGGTIGNNRENGREIPPVVDAAMEEHRLPQNLRFYRRFHRRDDEYLLKFTQLGYPRMQSLVLMAGLNDALQMTNPLTFAATYFDFLRHCRERYDIEHAILVQPNHLNVVTVGSGADEEYVVNPAQQINADIYRTLFGILESNSRVDRFLELATDMNITTVPVSAGSTLWDGVHLTTEEHQQLAGRIASALPHQLS